MVRLVAAKCPTCGAGLQVDPAQEVVSCTYCNTSAFVKTRTRPATQRVLRERVPVIDLNSGSTAMVVVLTSFAILAAGGVFAGFALQRAPSAPPGVTSTESKTSPAESVATQPSITGSAKGPRTPSPPPPPGMMEVEVDGLKILRPARPPTAPTATPHGMKEVEVDGLRMWVPDPAPSPKPNVPTSKRGAPAN